MVEEIECLFVDVTEEARLLHESIEELEWVGLAKAMDRHLAYPEVRCPFGCSEFLHKVNMVPMEEFLWHFSNYQMETLCRPVGGRLWTDCIAPSFPSTSLILHKFPCRPSIIIDDDGPMILLCREHSKQSKSFYLHVPESPTGNIYTPNANAFSPVVIRPRTNRNFKRNVHSDTFCTVDQVGGFCGADSCYMTTSSVIRSDPLSSLRDCISLQGRPDIRAQLYDRSTDKKSLGYMSKRAIDKIVYYAEKMNPLPLSSLEEWRTSTYIDCGTAIELQENTYCDGSKTIRVYDACGWQQRLFLPPWPTFFAMVHPMDEHGQRFNRIMDKDFGLWRLFCMTTAVSELWESIARSVADNISWDGHWLRFASCHLHLQGTKRTCKVFSLKKRKDIVELFSSCFGGIALNDLLKEKDSTASLFSKCNDVLVVDRHLPSDDELNGQWRSKRVVICLHPRQPYCAQEQSGVFELRCLLSSEDETNRSKFQMHVRHSGKKMWRQDGTKHCVKTTQSNATCEAWRNAYIGVYCRIETPKLAAMKRRYMSLIGGQSCVYCGIHKCPLVLNHFPKSEESALRFKCIQKKNAGDSAERCNCYCAYICPYHSNCKSGICQNHLMNAKSTCSEDHSPDTIFYLSQAEETYSTLSSSESGGICNPLMDMTNVDIAPETLGPVAAHEIPQDFLDDQYQEELDIAHQTDGDWVDIEEVEEPDADWINIDSESLDHDTGEEEQIEAEQIEHPFDAGIATDTVEQEEWARNIICTQVGAENPAVRIRPGSVCSSSVPLYVLLNMQGHLLTRARSKLRMNKKQRAIFEKLVSRSKSAVIPLVYGEAQLFPSIFWQSLPDGTIPGAIPTALWCDAHTLQTYGIASMREHSKQRITNPASLTSVDPSYHFQQMDVNLNLGLRGKDTRIVLNRGFADHQGSDGIRFRQSSDSAELYGETMENHANVHKLSALVRERQPHFFFTQSCNQESCGGLRILRDWVTSDEAKLVLQLKYGLDLVHADRFLRESAASYILRSWNEVVELWMKYIIYSKEEPLGKIEYAWYRKEFQEKQGNPSHIHAILKTVIDISVPDGLNEVVKKIRGCVADLIHLSEAIEMQNKGFISSSEQLIEMLEKAKSYLTHTCHERCKIPRTNRDGTTMFVCKAQDNFLRTYTPSMHSMQILDVCHSSEAKAIYNRLGLMDGDVPIHECLKSERHVPVCSSSDPKFSPTNGHLFVCYPSSQNLQFTTGHAISAYLVKYVAGFDEVAIAVVRASRKNESNSVPADVESLKNTKITSNKIRADQKKRKLNNTARILTQMECLTVVLGSPLVTSTEQFINMPTSPREYRSAFFKTPPVFNFERVDDFIDEDVVHSQEVRKEMKFPKIRLFSAYQEEVIRDEKQSSLSIDAITVFSARPPELRFVNSVRLYLRWFKRVRLFRSRPKTIGEYTTIMKARLHRDIQQCEWLDGFDMKVMLRRGAIREIVDYIKNRELCDCDLFGGSQRSMNNMTQLLEQINKLYRQFELGEIPNRRHRTGGTSERQYMQLCEKFLCEEKSPKLPIVWSTPIYPRNKGRFLVQLLLLFGRFETEYELMLQGNMKHAYIHAGLFKPEEPRSSFDALMKRYVLESLSYSPGSVFQRDRNLSFAESILAELLLDESNDPMIIETPCVLQSMIERSTGEKVQKWRMEQTTSFINSLYAGLTGAGFRPFELPNKADLLKLHSPDGQNGRSVNEVPYTYPPMHNEEGPQNVLSFHEQRAILVSAKSTISRYKNGTHHKNIVVCGGPGNGKTTVCEEICLYAFSQGLSGMVTSIVADRSKTLGGIHIHSLCSIPISERNNMSPGRAAEQAIASLYRKPELLYLWQKLDFLCIDEFGAVSAEMLATVDIIARHVKESNKFMGGILLVCTMDPRQLLPVTGTAIMLSMNMMTEFSFVELKESVRAANDEHLRRLCKLSRTINWTDDEKEEFKALVKNNCNFVSSLNDDRIPTDAIFVFGRKSPCRGVEQSILQRIRNSGTRVIRCDANDEESSFAGNWKSASTAASAQLSNRVKEKKELYLFEKGRYEFTHNRHGAFQQGQLAILLELNEHDVKERNKLEFYKGPPGCKEFPPLSEFTPDNLRLRGWEPVSVPFECSQPRKIWSTLLGRRTQYGVRLRVAATIHASQGATFGKLVTAVTNTSTYPDLNFTLWEAAQVVVLISRTRRCSDIYFIGNPDEVAEQLVGVLSETNRYLKHIQALTQRLCGELDQTPVLMRPPIFRPFDIVLDQVPAVYLLVSTKHVGYMYIGETSNIRKRLGEHNSGLGSKFTNNARLRPWALFGFVVGLGNRGQRHLFEQTWKHLAMEHRNRERRRTPAGVLQIAIDLAFAKNQRRDKDSKLVVQQCGEMVDRNNQFVLVEGT